MMEMFPGSLPWHFGGEEGFTYAEIEAMLLHQQRRAQEARKSSRNNGSGSGSGTSPMARRRRKR